MQDMDGNEVDFRPLTREEQLEWEVKFLNDQILAYQTALHNAQTELLLLKQQRLAKMCEDYDRFISSEQDENEKTRKIH